MTRNENRDITDTGRERKTELTPNRKKKKKRERQNRKKD
jgi:hypothetical protein